MTRHTQPIVERLFRPMERSTRQRSSIRTVMEEAGRPLLPAEILGAAQREVPAIGLATVYRNIKQLMEAGEVQAVDLPGEATRYELSGRAHHHHFPLHELQPRVQRARLSGRHAAHRPRRLCGGAP